jgi:hypothetical protein
MTDTRKGFLTPEQEKKVDDLVVLQSKLAEALDGPAIALADNQGLERLKVKLVEKWPEALPIMYEIVDAIFDAIPVVKKQS